MFIKRMLYCFLVITMFLTALPSGAVYADSAFLPDTYIEAEAGSVSANVVRLNSEYASGGIYCKINAAGITDTSNIITSDIFWEFDIEKGKAANYYVYLRVLFPNSTATSFYYSWDNSVWKVFIANTDKQYQWIKLDKAALVSGTHKLKISRMTDGVCFDAVYLTSSSDFEPSDPEGLEKIPTDSDGTNSFLQMQKKEYEFTEPGIIIEAEDTQLMTGMSIVTNSNASGKSAVKCGVTNSSKLEPDKGTTGALEFTFKADNEKSYEIWFRAQALNGAADSFFRTYNDRAYGGAYGMPITDEFVWGRLFSGVVPNNEEVTFRMYPRESGWIVDQFVIVSKPSYTPNGIVKEISSELTLLEPEYGMPPVSPPKGVHPRIFFTEDKINSIKEKLNHPENAKSKESFDVQVSSDLNITLSYNANALEVIESKALYYALYGDEKVGQEAAKALLKIQNWNDLGATTEPARIYGRALYTMAVVYDWCYDLFTEEEKLSMIETMTGWSSAMEMGWPPAGQTTINSHAAESQLLREMLAFAIAVYDERPDIWNFIGGRFYADYVPERNWYYQAQRHFQGQTYGNYRHQWDFWALSLILGMGAESPFESIYDMCQFAYGSDIYPRRADEALFMEGDGSGFNSFRRPEFLFWCYVYDKDGYIKDEFLRVALDAGKSGFYTSSGLPLTVYLLFNEPGIERKSIKNLPLSRYFGTPVGTMFAKTGWDDGKETESVSVMMHVGEYYFGGHQHNDAGDFQIYYKGPLANDSGFYEYWNAYNHANYMRQTIAKNCMLVLDPNEPIRDGSLFNYGGQYLPNDHPEYENIISDPKKHRATVDAQEIDPENRIDPNYTYMKANLTNSYSEKVEDYKRSFMFLNFKDEKVPAALIVYDKLTSADASFKKTWLLHGHSDPMIKNSRSVWTTSGEVDDLGYKLQGKMVADHLLPKADNISIDVIGGPEEGWSIINGVDITAGNTSPFAEENTYRMEISPKQNEKTNHFLNCIQVTDESNTSYLPTTMIETDDFYGLKISDRVVLFSKSGECVTGDIEIKSNVSGNNQWTICDIEPGQWKITTSDGEQTVNVTKEGGVLSFDANGGTVSATRTGDEIITEKEELVLNESKRYYVKMNGNIVYFPAEAEIINGKLMVPISDIVKRMGLETRTELHKKIFYDEKQDITVQIALNENILTKNGEGIEMTNPVFKKDGEYMVELRLFAESFNYIVQWNEYEEMAVLVPNLKLALKGEDEGYAKVISSNNDDASITEAYGAQNTLDRNLATIWSAEGVGRYFTLELENETILENVELLLNPNSNRSAKFEVQTSLDGENFESVYEGTGDSQADGTEWEVFTFDISKEVKAKYVRYIGHGSDKSAWNAVREIRFKIGEPISWFTKCPQYLDVIKVTSDGVDDDETHVYVNDSNSRTVWNALGKGRYIQFELEKEEDICGVAVMFNPESKRTPMFEIQVSTDGENFETVYKGKGNYEIGPLTWEKFDFTPVTAKYVRYVGFGSDISRWNSVNEIRIKKSEYWIKEGEKE